ncbi:MAG: hypothetical protein RIS44_2337 [Pseudomonadota bacterium]|jgi:nucleoside-diphosphate-sugar epimerase
MKIAYITGATGCVGRNLVDILLTDNWEIVALHRKSSDLSRLKGCNIKFQEVDLHDFHSVNQAIPLGVDAIFHVAANTSHWSKEADQQWKDNVLATRNLAQVALAKKTGKFIFTSTGATLGFQGMDENESQKIDHQYIRTKRLSELEVYKLQKQGLHVNVLHPIIVIGAYDYNNYSTIFNELKNSPVKVALPGRIAFCHADDVARAHLQTFYKGGNGESFVLGGTYTTWLDLFQRICKLQKIQAPQKATPTWQLLIASYFMEFYAKFSGVKPKLTPELVRLIGDAPDVEEADQVKAFKTLGYESKSLDRMLEDCYAWLCKEKLI